ncbi:MULTISPECIES: hypothetical protein [Salinivibrio]|uniref:hypothetical protein n=1 Tax=Salinivibrio TaxID=51366 RepID=UPI000989511A|nr:MULTISPECIES: hypothetical protein [Salinivibrio]OOF15354.1 hypothetical protein BZG84_12665 [Salinivibrio sp. PR932]OOF32149.1 hypothetical protein BZJ20_03150 [Salinivibrio proteolyticus]
MYAYVAPSLVSAILGAQLVLSLALLKGEICPGQRGRFHHAYWVLVFAWVILVPSSFLATIPFLFLGLFAFRSKTGKTRHSGPIPLLHVANLTACVAWLIITASQGWMVAVFGLLQVVLLGASAGHGLLVRAKSRLQAFDNLLPLASVLALMATVLLVAVAASLTTFSTVNINALFAGVGLGLLGIAASIWHLLKHTKPAWWRLMIGFGFLFAASVSLNTIVMG